MKLNADCVRDVLLYLEKNLSLEGKRFIPCDRANLISGLSQKHSSTDIIYSVIQLSESGYIKTDFDHTGSSSAFSLSVVYYIMPKGHDLISKIADEESWRSKIRPVTNALGSISMSVLETLACGVTEGALSALQIRLMGTP